MLSFVAIVCCTFATLAVEDPQLDRIRDEVTDDDDDDEHGSGVGGAAADVAMGAVAAAAGLLLRAVIEDARLPAFASHPYAAGHRFGLTVPAEHEIGIDASARRKATGGMSRVRAATGATPGVAARIALDGAWQYRGLWRGRFAIELDGGKRFGAAAHLYAWGDPGVADHMLLASVRAHVVIGNWRHALVRTGPAFDLLHSWTPTTRVTALGADWGVGADIFIEAPWILSLDAAAGILGRSRYLAARATIGITVHRVEIFGGYEHKHIGRAGVGGPLVGLRLWF